MNSRTLRIAAAGLGAWIAGALLQPMSVDAALLIWDAKGAVPPDGVFDVAVNWNPDIVPVAGHQVQFDLPNIYTVTLDSNEVADELRGLGGVVTLASDSSTLRTFKLSTGVADANISGGSIQIGTGTNPVHLSLPNVTSGSGQSVSVMNIGSTADGAVLVIGSNSLLDVFGATNHSLGFSGNQGVLIVSDGATANFGIAGAGGTLNVGDSSNSGSSGAVLIDTGGTLNTGHIDIAPQTSGATGSMTVDGFGSSINQILAGANLTVGSASGGTGTIDVNNGGTFTTGTGTTTISATGTVNIGVAGNGTFNADGTVIIDGGTINAGGGLFFLAAGQNLTASNSAQVNLSSLGIGRGSTLDINSGADFLVQSIFDKQQGSGIVTLVVDGAGTSLTSTETSFGRQGITASVTFRQQATGDLGELNLADQNSSIQLLVEGASFVSTGDIRIGATESFGTPSGTLTVDGPGSLVTQTLAGAALTVGRPSGTGAGTINLRNGGTFDSGTGTITINASGTVNVGMIGDGTFNADGPMFLDGGTLNLFNPGDAFNLEAGQSFTASNDAQVNFDTYVMRGGSTYEINSGADLSSAVLNVGTFLGGGDGTLIVDGSGSTVTSASTSFGANGNTADVTFRQQATGDLGTFNLADSSSDTTAGNLSVESGGTIQTGDIRIATFNSQATGALTVDGSNSLLDQTLPGATLTLGSTSGGAGTITVQNDGTFTTGTGTTTINATGTLNVGLSFGGRFNANGPLIVDGGTMNMGFSSGSAFDLADGQTLTASNHAQISFGVYPINDNTTFEINSGADLSLSSSLSVGAFSSFGSGTLVVDGLGSSVTAGAGSFGGGGNTANVTFRQQATGDLGPTLITNGPAAGSIGTLTIESGAAVITANLGMATVDGDGSTALVTIDGAGSSLTQTGTSTLTIGNAVGGSATINIQNDGTLTTGTGATTINATGTINLSGGALNATTIDHTNNGSFSFIGGTLSVDTFQGTIDQDGGTLSPGASPGMTTISSDYNLNAGTLAIELGGLFAGTEHDKVDVAGALNLGLASVLDVLLINAFAPGLGDSFDILDFGSIAGGFNTINLPILGGSLDWDTSNLLIDGTLSVISNLLDGDLNADGFVGIDDLNIVLGNWNQNVPPADPAADPSGDNFIGIEDLNVVLGNWNAGTPPSESYIPEPGATTFLLIGSIAFLRRKHQCI